METLITPLEICLQMFLIEAHVDGSAKVFLPVSFSIGHSHFRTFDDVSTLRVISAQIYHGYSLLCAWRTRTVNCTFLFPIGKTALCFILPLGAQSRKESL